MPHTQATNPQRHGEVVQFRSNDSYLRNRRIEGGPPSGGGGELPPTSGGAANPPPPGGHEATIATLQTKVNGAFLWLGLLSFGFAGAFLFLINQTNSVSRDVTDVKMSVAAQSSTLQGVKESVDRIADKLDKRK